MDAWAVVSQAMAANPALAGFAGFSMIAGLNSFNGDVNNTRVREMMRRLGKPPVAATQLGLHTGEILARAKGAAWRLDQMNATLQLLSPASAAKSIEALESAMSGVTSTARLIQKFNFSDDADFDQITQAFAACEKAFAGASKVADDGLRAISDLHSQIVEVHATRLMPLDRDIQTVSQLFAVDLQRSTEHYKVAKQEAVTHESVARNMEASVSSLEARIRDNETSSQFSDAVFDVFTLGIARAVDGAPPDPFGFRGQLDEARRQANSARQMRDNANDNRTVLRFQMQQVREQAMYLEALQSDIPKLTARLNRSKELSEAIQRQFADIKDRASLLARQIETVRNTAANTRDLGVVQSEFTNGLLTICQQVLIDPRLLDEVKSVTDIIDSGFKLADLPKSTRAKIDELVAQMSGRPSMCDVGTESTGPLGIPLAKRARMQLSQSISYTDRFPIGQLGLPAVQSAASTALAEQRGIALAV